MNPILIAKEKEDKLREAACLGDVEAIEYLAKDTNVNAKHEINGWTALHWAAKRGHVKAVYELLIKGADPRVLTEKSETPFTLATDPEIRKLLNEYPHGTKINNHSPIIHHPITPPNPENVPNLIPNYLKNPQLNGQVDIGPRRRLHTSDIANMPSTTLPSHTDDLVLKIRIAESPDPDFIEIELSRRQLTFANLLDICSSELNIKSSIVSRIRKLPDTRLRNDADVKRLMNMQKLELVLLPTTPVWNSDSSSSTPRGSLNAYQSITSNKDQTILY